MRLHIPGIESHVAEGGASEGAFPGPLAFFLAGSKSASFSHLANSTDGPALILLSLICANFRNCLRPASVLRALDLLLDLGRYLTDETKLDRLVPYLVAILEDDAATVRSAALRTLTQTVSFLVPTSILARLVALR